MSIYATSDLHGNLKLWNMIKEYLKPEDTLVFLGDAADRGKHGIKIMQELLNRPNTIYLKGNHEDFLYKEMISEKKYNNQEDLFCSFLWAMNGGDSTYNDFKQLSIKDQDNILEIIRNMPLSYTYLNKNKITIICSHSGNPKDIWDRKHFMRYKKIDDNTIIVHGHTPINSIKKEVNSSKDSEYPFWYNDNKKCCIDCGSFLTNKALLLNLDTLEAMVFETEKEINKYFY